jgi:hypothetical protein
VTSVSLIRSRSERRGAAIALALAAAAILLPLLMAVAGRDFWLYRNLIAAWIPLAIALAAGLTTRRDASVLVTGGFMALAITAVLLSGVFAIRVAQGSIRRDDWRGVARCLGQRQPDRALLLYPSFQATVLQLYRPEAQPMRSPRAIGEIDVVGDPPPTFNTPSGFHRASKRCSGSIPVTVYKASEPRLMAPTQIAPQPSSGGQPAIALVEARQ